MKESQSRSRRLAEDGKPQTKLPSTVVPPERISGVDNIGHVTLNKSNSKGLAVHHGEIGLPIVDGFRSISGLSRCHVPRFP